MKIKLIQRQVAEHGGFGKLGERSAVDVEIGDVGEAGSHTENVITTFAGKKVSSHAVGNISYIFNMEIWNTFPCTQQSRLSRLTETLKKKRSLASFAKQNLAYPQGSFLGRIRAAKTQKNHAPKTQFENTRG